MNKEYIASQHEGSAKMILDEIKQVVKIRYGKFAETGGNKESCWPSKQQPSSGFAVDQGLYNQEALSSVPEVALDLSRGCGKASGRAAEAGADAIQLRSLARKAEM